MTLVFPRTRPLGANSTNSRQAIGDDAAFPTQVVDYLKLTIHDPKTNSLIDTIYLYLPPKLQENYRTKYNGVELGAVGSAAVAAAGKNMAAGGISDGFGEDVKRLAEAAKPALGYSLGAEVINNVVGMTGGSGSLTANNLSALTQGKIFNPYEETIFQGTEFRDHSFEFKLVPKNAGDVQTIYTIINKLRRHMLPAKDGDNWLKIPDKFRLEVVRWQGGPEGETISTPGNSGGYLAKLMKFPHYLVLHDMGIDLSPDGNYAGLMSYLGGDTDFGPVSYNMRLSFKETKYVTREDYPE
jgi:hypothetical protein